MAADLHAILKNTIAPALDLLPEKMTSGKSMVMLLAIGLQESRFEHTHQIGGPAHSWWQFERAGGVRGVIKSKATKEHALGLCYQRGIALNESSVFGAMEHDQVLAAGMARLLLWTDPRPLPKIGDAQSAWDCYLRNWRPGKPHPQTWGKLYDTAMFAVMRYQQDDAA
ncbi:hypothetical protein [Microvirga sp. 17 mud 1-3]|uniref:hypothetical protein n=1 Tax=Microvirga sp. 17 mud 1-3 TaxID=2082949 RepID=UPI000D6D5541|nr:hypothetical protein [Microvirga sp. 17 mud 1-3]AWM87363.1 hypothetical protein C4E04_11880 [Microvirga sp. 17 mud 1-3]